MNLDTELIEAIAANIVAKGKTKSLDEGLPDPSLVIEAGLLHKVIDCHFGYPYAKADGDAH